MIGTGTLMSEPPCARQGVPHGQTERRATWPNGEWGYSTRCHMLGPERPEAVSPDRALRTPTFSHFLIVNKTSLLLSLSSSSSAANMTGVQAQSRPTVEPWPNGSNLA